jgi:hypothetical protein
VISAFELMKGMRVTMTIHAAWKVEGWFVLVD